MNPAYRFGRIDVAAEQLRPLRRQPRDESGQILLLVLIYVVVTVSFVLVVMSVSSVHIARQRLQHIADAAALDAADAMSYDDYYDRLRRTGKSDIMLTTPGVIAAATDYVNTAPGREDFATIKVLETSHTSNGRSATVALAATIDLPLLAFLNIGRRIPLDATATAATRQPAAAPPLLPADVRE